MADQKNETKIIQRQIQDISEEDIFFKKQFIQKILTCYPEHKITFTERKEKDGSVKRSVSYIPIKIVDKISSYLALILLILVAICLLMTIQQVFQDFESEREVSLINAKILIEQCREDYFINLCDPSNRVESTQEFCLVIAKEQCMNQNPQLLARTQSSTIKIIGRSIDSFFSQISNKSAIFIFTIILMIGFLILQFIKSKL